MQQHFTFGPAINELHRNWKYYLLVTVVMLGVITMTGFKVSVSGGNAWFVGLVLFTEISAGVSMFAQTMLRQIDTEAANTAFRFSVVARLMMALVGIALFLEHAEVTYTDAGRIASFVPGIAVSVSAFMTYEISNGLMLLIEYMFSKMLSRPEGLDRFNKRLTSWGLIERPFESNEQDMWLRLDSMVERLVSQRAATHEQLSEATEQLIELQHLLRLENTYELRDTIIRIREYSEIGKSMCGVLYTSAPNVQSWYCPVCQTHNTKGLRAKASCSNCNHTLTDE